VVTQDTQRHANNGEQQFAMDFLKTSGHTHFEEKSKSVSDQHQTTDATASAVWFCRSFHQYLESKQLLAEPLLVHEINAIWHTCLPYPKAKRRRQKCQILQPAEMDEE